MRGLKMNGLDKFEKEMDLLRADINLRNEQVKHIKFSRRHMVISTIAMITEIVLLIAILMKL